MTQSSLLLGPPWVLVAAFGVIVSLSAPTQMLAQTVAKSRAVVLREEEPFQGSLQGVDDDGTIRLTAESGDRSIPMGELVRFGQAVEARTGPQVLLNDGSLLVVAAILELNRDELVVDCDIWGEVSLPLDRLAGVIFQPPAAPLARDNLAEELLTADGRYDRIQLENGDRIQGLIKSMPLSENLSATIPALINVTTADGVEVAIPAEKAIAVTFNPALRTSSRSPASHIAMGMVDGGEILVDSFKTSGDQTTITTIGGVSLAANSESLWDDCVSLQPLRGDVAYASDLKIASYRHTPFFDLEWPYHLDRNTLGGKLRADGGIRRKGIGMHSRSRLAVITGGKFKRFEADLAIDATSNNQGSVVYRVYVNRDSKWSVAYQSDVIRGGEAPTPISVDIENAAAILLIVDFAENGDVLDRANWLDARLH